LNPSQPSNPRNQPLHGKEHVLNVILQHNPIEIVFDFLNAVQGPRLKAYQFGIQVKQLVADLLHSFCAHAVSFACLPSGVDSTNVLGTGGHSYCSTPVLRASLSSNI
jgi:hypothetical protein